MSHKLKNKCREMTGLINYHHVKLLHVVILDLKGVAPTIYQNFFELLIFLIMQSTLSKNSPSSDVNDRRNKNDD